MRSAALIAFFSCGCSFIFVRPMGDRPPPAHVDCTTSILAPVLDLTFAGLNGWGALNAAATDQATWDAHNNGSNVSRQGVIAFGLTSAVIVGASAIYGFKSTEACRAAEKAEAALIPPPPPD